MVNRSSWTSLSYLRTLQMFIHFSLGIIPYNGVYYYNFPFTDKETGAQVS